MERPYLESLFEMGRQLNESEDVPTIFDTVVNHLPKVLDAKYCSLFTRNPSSGDLEIKAHNHTTSARTHSSLSAPSGTAS